MTFLKNVSRFADTASDDQIQRKLVELETLRDHLILSDTREDCSMAIQILKRELVDRREVNNAIKRVTA